jgi:hypothetical protein
MAKGLVNSICSDKTAWHVTLDKYRPEHLPTAARKNRRRHGSGGQRQENSREYRATVAQELRNNTPNRTPKGE